MAVSTSPTTVAPTLDHAATERARLANEARARLLRSGGAVTIEMLARGLGKRPATVRQWATRHRAAGDLVAVVHDGVLLVPTFQLDAAFSLREPSAEVIRRLQHQGLDGWAVWDWFVTPNTWLDGATPRVALEEAEPQRVLRAVAGLFQE